MQSEYIVLLVKILGAFYVRFTLFSAVKNGHLMFASIFDFYECFNNVHNVLNNIFSYYHKKWNFLVSI